MFWKVFWWLFTPQGETFIKAMLITIILGLLVWAYIENKKEGD